jgi:hypothetical protein
VVNDPDSVSSISTKVVADATSDIESPPLCGTAPPHHCPASAFAVPDAIESAPAPAVQLALQPTPPSGSPLAPPSSSSSSAVFVIEFQFQLMWLLL